MAVKIVYLFLGYQYLTLNTQILSLPAIRLSIFLKIKK